MSSTQPQGNLYDKYGTRNPIARVLVRRFLDCFERLALSTGVREAQEIGCGEGELARRLDALGFRVRGCDVGAEIIAIARERCQREHRDIEFSVCNILELTPDRDAAPLVVCCEVLEHLEDPERALDILAALAQPYLIASVPREPLWRILNMVRGKYLAHMGNTPGHLQHWGVAGFLSLLRTRFDVLKYELPLPWTIALCRVRG